jgi:hypothetical protein
MPCLFSVWVGDAARWQQRKTWFRGSSGALDFGRRVSGLGRLLLLVLSLLEQLRLRHAVAGLRGHGLQGLRRRRDPVVDVAAVGALCRTRESLDFRLRQLLLRREDEPLLSKEKGNYVGPCRRVFLKAQFAPTKKWVPTEFFVPTQWWRPAQLAPKRELAPWHCVSVSSRLDPLKKLSSVGVA